MNSYAIVSLITAIVFLQLGDMVYFRDTRNTTNRLVMLFCLFFAYYAFIEFAYRQTRFYDVAWLAYRIGVFWPLALSFLLHFIIVFTKTPMKGNTQLFYVVIYGPALVFPLIDLTTNWITAGMVWRYWGWNYVYTDSLAVYCYRLWFFGVYVAQIILCIRYYFKTSGKRQKRQAIFIAAGITIPIVISLTTGEAATIPIFTNIPDLTTAAALVGGIFLIFAIIKYELFKLSPATAAENILAAISDALLLVRPDGKIADINKAAVNLLGYQKSELIGHSVKELITEGKPSIYADEKLAEIIDMETEFETRNGNMIPVSVATSLLRDEEGEIQGAVCIARDLRYRKITELILQEKNRELEAANSAKSDFLATMSHELRTPLNAVMGFSELMLDGATGEINEEQKSCLNDILLSSHQLLNLVNDVLDLSRVESGKMSLVFESVNLFEIVGSAVQTVMPQIDEHGQYLMVNIGVLPLVRADVRRVRQIILNLLGNAIKFTPAGGKIRIEAERQGDYCRVSVIDNGVGIPEKDRKRIFEAFVQLELSQQVEKKGVGLGLAICHALVEAQGGSIWVESEPGKGSNFTFTLPVYRE